MAYLYRHIRLDKNEPFYIGVGGLYSFDNYERAYETCSRNIIWRGIIKKSKYEVEIVLEDLTSEQALEKEIEFIKLYGKICSKTGILANLTDGGFGTTGHDYPRTIEHRENIRKALKGKKRPKEVIDKILKTRKERIYKKSEETLKRMSIATKGEKNPFYGKKHTNESKLKLSKPVLNLETGIFYDSIKEACLVSSYKYDYFKQMLRNNRSNKTSFVRV